LVVISYDTILAMPINEDIHSTEGYEAHECPTKERGPGRPRDGYVEVNIRCRNCHKPLRIKVNRVYRVLVSCPRWGSEYSWGFPSGN